MSPICTGATLGRICTTFGKTVGATKIITSNKSVSDRSRDVDSGGAKIALSDRQSQLPVTQGWRYRAIND